MLYWLFYEKLFHVFTPFRVFGYATFRTAFSSLTALWVRACNSGSQALLVQLQGAVYERIASEVPSASKG